MATDENGTVQIRTPEAGRLESSVLHTHTLMTVTAWAMLRAVVVILVVALTLLPCRSARKDQP